MRYVLTVVFAADRIIEVSSFDKCIYIYFLLRAAKRDKLAKTNLLCRVLNIVLFVFKIKVNHPKVYHCTSTQLHPVAFAVRTVMRRIYLRNM